MAERRAVTKEILDETLHGMHKVFGSDNPSTLMLIDLKELNLI